jgi:hypothetical protein
MLEKEKRGFFKITGDQIGKLVLALALLGAAIYIGKRTVEKATPQSFVNPTDAEIIEAYGMDPEQYRLIREFEAEQERQRWAQEEAEALGLPPPPPPQ